MKDSIKILFQRYLNEDCTDSEIQELLTYFNIQENQETLKELILEELETGTYDRIPDIAEVDERLEAIHHQLHVYMQKAAAPKSFFRMSWLHIAAAVVVIAGASIFFIVRKSSSEEWQEQIAKNHITPGGNQAILRLANGRQINLSDIADGQVARQAGMKIIKTADGQLIYQATTTETEGTPNSYNTIETPAGGQWQVVLPDQSHVWLNAKSSLTYPTAFRGSERKVKLTGEAYFEIAPDKTKPFRVLSKDQTIEVLGTHFNVMAYADEQSEKTTLLEGSVKISAPGAMQLLRPGEQAEVIRENIQIKHNADLEEAIAWKNNYFKFNSRLEDIMNKIGRWYNVEIVYLDKPNPNNTFEGEISRKRDLSEILKIMEYTGNVHFSIKGRRILVSN